MPSFKEIAQKEKNLLRTMDFASILKEVEEMMSNLPRLLEEEEFKGGMQLNLAAIPDIPVTELGWTDVRTPDDDSEGQEIAGPARQQLMNFLQNIEGTDLEDKLTSLAAFYNGADPESTGQALNVTGLTPAQAISKVMSYLVFYKTLTKVISNFNAASAGFSFESFLSVLLAGKQIKANTGTIADFLTGDNIPISLKLYQEASVHVGGSFIDLVNDLVAPQFGHELMQYLVVMKGFGDVKEGLDIKGSLKWYRWNFTLDNVVNIISQASDKYSKCIQLPAEFIEKNAEGMEAFDYSSTLPALSNLPSPEELESEFIAQLDVELKEAGIRLHAGNPDSEDPIEKMSQVERILQAIDYAKSDESFNPADPKKFGGVEQGVVRGVSNFNYKLLFRKIRDLLPEKTYREQQAVWKAVSNANSVIINKHAASKKAAERTKMLAGKDVFASIEDSVEFYNSATSETKKLALQNSRGYLSTLQFSLNRGQVFRVHELAGTPGALPAGQSDVKIGELNIGDEYVQQMLNSVVDILNRSLFEVFTSLRTLTTSVQGFFAGGLADDDLATAAVESANSISQKTEELRPDAK